MHAAAFIDRQPPEQLDFSKFAEYPSGMDARTILHFALERHAASGAKRPRSACVLTYTNNVETYANGNPRWVSRTDFELS